MKQNKLGIMNMKQLVFNMSLPLMISLLVQSLYNIVDSIFVAKISETALTAVSLAFPIHILMIAFGVGTAVGVNALLSRSVGAKQYGETTKVADTGVVLALVATLVFMLGSLLSGWFVSLFTDDAAIAADGKIYLLICMLFCGGSFIGTMYQRFLQSVGNTVDSMISLTAGAVTNLILDPIMIFGIGPVPAMGVAGAAIATVIGQWVSAFIAIYCNQKKNALVKVDFKGFHLDFNTVKNIYRVGLPTIITQALGSIMVSGVNAILISFSATAVAFFGVYYKLQSFLFMPMNGLGQAAIPIAGFNYGAKQYERIMEMLKIMLVSAVVISLIMTVVFFALPSQLLSLFNASEEMLAIGVPALRIISITFAFASVTMILGYTVSGLGNGLVNMIGTALRQVVLLIPCIYLLGNMGGINVVWYAFWISEVFAMGYAVIHSRKILRQKQILL